MCNRIVRKAAICYTAGSLGAFANAMAIVLAANVGMEAMFGVSFLSEWSLDWLYPRLVWGGVLAFLFLLPLYQNKWVVRGLVWSIVPTIPHFFIIFPGQADTLVATNYQVGVVTIVSSYVFNCIWGLIASYMVKHLEEPVTNV